MMHNTMNIYKRNGRFAFDKGIKAEITALSYFLKAGWILLQKRARTPLGEIDLILKKEKFLLFVEVKYRKTLISAHFALNKKQQKRLFDAGNYWLASNMNLPYENARFDLFLVDQTGQFQHLENIILDDNNY